MNNSCLFRNIMLVTPDENQGIEIIDDVFVAVKSDKISYVGKDETQATNSLGSENYEVYAGQGRLILPALANTHGHLPMTLFRNQADDKNLHDWLFQVIFPREEHLSAKVVERGARLAIAEMIRSGTGAAAEMYYYHDAVAKVALDSGFRINFCCDAKAAPVRNKATLDPQILIDARKRWLSDTIKISLLVHSVYLYEAEIYPQLAQLARQEDLPVQVHVAETVREVEECLKKYGRRPPAQLEEFGFFQTSTIAAHCVHLDSEDRKILARNNVYVAHNPASNLKLGSGIADIQALIDAGAAVSLGTDGAASNNNLDLYREMRLASLLAKSSTGRAESLPAQTVLTMATRTGMQALGFKESGRISTGMQADLQIVNLETADMTPLGNAAAALVYSCDSKNVESLMVAGQWLMKKHELTTIDEEKVRFEANETADWINKY